MAPRTRPDPHGDLEPLTDRLPAKLSPSRLSDFDQCPKLFYYKSVLRLPSPATLDTTRGTLAHHALEKVFDLPRGSRTPAAAKALVAPHWQELAKLPDYAHLAELPAEQLGELLSSAEAMVEAYFAIEDPNRFDPESRELYVSARLGDATVHGYIDRLDCFVREDGTQHWYVSDYKTGKVPQDRFLDKAFFAMNVYAALLEEQRGIRARELRLLYVRNANRSDVRRQGVTDATLTQVRRKVKVLHDSIRSCASRGEFAPKKSVLCNWCNFQEICPAWAPELAGVPIELPTGPARR